jgi:TctA family transporter
VTLFDAFQNLLSPGPFSIMMIGVTIGIAVGVMPGITAAC